MAQIALVGRLGQGRVALVDDADLPLLSGYRWHLSRRGYPRAYLPGTKGRTVNLHQLLRAPDGSGYRDHVSGDPLDNRRVNLRPCTVEENNRNRRAHRNNKTGFKGVSAFGTGFRAVIHQGRKQIYLGTFPHVLLAALAYNAAATALHGPFARLNDVDLAPLLGASNAAD